MQAEGRAYKGLELQYHQHILKPETCELYQPNQDKKHKPRQFLVNQEV